MLKRSSIALLLLAAAVRPATAVTWDDVRPEYRHVLELQAAGQEEPALTALAALETPLASGDEKSKLDKLYRLKLRVIKDLIDQPEVLVPIIQLHHDAYLYYREHKQAGLAMHSRVMAAELADIYVDRAPGDGPKIVAARVLTSLGGYLQDGISFPGATALYQRALELDPRDGAAQYGLGTMFEKVGQYKDAVTHFAKLLEIDPQNPEAKLRLGINLMRTGEPQRGETALAQLVAAHPPGWVASLAAQELARRYAESRRAPQAIALLRQDAEELPGDDEPLVALAFLLERSGDSAGAQTVAERAARTAGKLAGPGPRQIYNTTSSTTLDEVRARLKEATQPRLRLLADALAATAGTEASAP